MNNQIDMFPESKINIDWEGIDVLIWSGYEGCNKAYSILKKAKIQLPKILSIFINAMSIDFDDAIQQFEDFGQSEYFSFFINDCEFSVYESYSSSGLRISVGSKTAALFELNEKEFYGEALEKKIKSKAIEYVYRNYAQIDHIMKMF